MQIWRDGRLEEYLTKRRLQLMIRINDECRGWQDKDYEDFAATNRQLIKKRTVSNIIFTVCWGLERGEKRWF